MKTKLIKVIISSLIVVGIAFGGYKGYKAYFGKKTVVSTNQYITTTVKKMNLKETIQGTGAAYSATTKDVIPNNNGTLQDLNVKVGDTVTAGQKLYVSDSDELRKAVTTAQNNLTKQNLTLSSDENAEKVDDNKIAQDKIAVTDATTQLNYAKKQLSLATVTAPIGGVITAVNSSNGDSVSPSKAVLTISDMSTMKVKISVDELDINKVKAGQKADVKFDAVSGKTFEGTVESIAETGTTSNNVTTYDVVVGIKDPSGIKAGMNANVTIAVESKDNALVIPVEALVEQNGKELVRVENTSSSGATQTGTSANSTGASNSGSLKTIKIGMETQDYIEVTEGLTEGEKVLIKMPSTSSTTNNSNKNIMGGFGGSMGGDMTRGNMGGQAPQGGQKN